MLMRLIPVFALVLIVSGCPSASDSPSGTDSNQELPNQFVGDNPEGAILPTRETIESGEYTPLSRPLYLYVNKKALAKPETAALLTFYLSDETRELVTEVGYVNTSEETYTAQKKALEAAIAEAGTKMDGDIKGEILVDGSSTVYPISQAVAETFSAQQRGIRVSVSVSGTGGGMKKFYSGEIDICDASRAIKESEVEECKKNHIEFMELIIGVDGLTVVVNPENDWIAGISVADLKKIWEPTSTVKKWSDINPDFPDVEIVLYGPDTDSGTFEYFTDEVCGEKGACRADYQQGSDDNFLVTGVAGDKNALGYFGYAYYIENKGKLKALAIAGEHETNSE